MSTTASSGLAEAWLRKARVAEADLNHAAKAPALFRPEFVAQRQRDLALALANARYWHSQAVTA